MANSVVYTSILGAVMASLPPVSTRLVVFDTEVVDLTDDLDDPVEVLISDLYEDGAEAGLPVAASAGIAAAPTDFGPRTGRS